MLVHTVYFWLKAELSADDRAKFRRSLETLKDIPSVEVAYVGTPAPTAKRPVIDDTYSFALTVVCRDVAAHDAYQVDPLHKAFVQACSGMWTRVLIYDAA